MELGANAFNETDSVDLAFSLNEGFCTVIRENTGPSTLIVASISFSRLFVISTEKTFSSLWTSVVSRRVDFTATGDPRDVPPAPAVRGIVMLAAAAPPPVPPPAQPPPPPP